MPASLALHLLPAAVLLFALPGSLSRPAREQTLNVSLVPPPERQKERKAEPVPPPPKPKAEQTPPPEAPKPEDAKKTAEKQPSPRSADTAQRIPFPVLKPVVQFGEKDAGPRRSPAGDSATDGGASPSVPEKPVKQAATETKAEPPAAAAEPPADHAPDKSDSPGVNILTSSVGEAAPAPTAPTAEAKKPAEEPKPQPKPEAATTAAAEAPKGLKLHEAKTLFSRSATDDLVATTAMGNMPRGVRASELCLTELREQLLNASPPYFPELLPSARLKKGTVLDVRGAAFRTNAQWYDLSYRCEVNENATKVVSFAYGVGAPIPPGEWKRRGLPVQ